MNIFAPPKSLYYRFKKGHGLFDLVRKLFSKNYHYNAAYYKDMLSHYVNFSTYLNIFDNTISLTPIHTNIDIQRGILGGSPKSITFIHGKPLLIFSEKKLSIYMYKWKFNGIKTKCEVHFYNNKAFMVNYIYNQLDSDDKDYVLKAIESKYLASNTNAMTLVRSKITDQNNNILFITDFVHGFKATYLSNCESDWYEAMSSQVNAKRDVKRARAMSAEKNFYDKI